MANVSWFAVFSHFTVSWRAWLLLATAATAAVIVLAMGPIEQPAAYHDFADQRALLGVPNFWNVVSSLPFLLAGLYGLWSLARSRDWRSLSYLRPAYRVFFAGAALVAFGSAWYHWSPSNATLAWDRLPMALAFAAFLVAILGERLHPAFVRRGLLPAVVIGALSVIGWQASGDLRAYVLVQFLPVVLIPGVLLLYPARLPGGEWAWAVLLAYALAKAFELLDAPVYHWLGISGHTLKHLVAAGGVWFVALMIRTDLSSDRTEP